MATKQEKKRFIVTFVDSDIDQKAAAKVLDVPEKNVQDGIMALATEDEIRPADVFHFEGLGSASLTLTKAEVEKCNRDKRVRAVEEDLEMHIFQGGVAPALDEESAGFEESDLLESDISEPEDLEKYMESYLEGYQRGTADAYGNMLRGMAEMPGDEHADSASAQRLPWFLWFLRRRLRRPPITSPVTQPIPWNISMVKAPAAWARGIDGHGVKVAVLDTGIASHPDLIISGGVSFVPGVASFNDGHSHGTHCAGIVAARNNTVGVVGVAPKASLYAVKVLSDAGSGSTSWILAGMAWARQNGMNIVSMSLGSESCQSVAYTNAISQLHAAGVTVICAAGNGFQNPNFPCVGSPGNSPGAIAVAAVDSNGVAAPFSSRGTHCCPPGANPVTIAGPGVTVKSTVLNNNYGNKSGTSMACPHIAGAAALIKQRFPTFTPAQIRSKLVGTCSDLGVPGNDPVYGSGLVNCDGATL